MRESLPGCRNRRRNPAWILAATLLPGLAGAFSLSLGWAGDTARRTERARPARRESHDIAQYLLKIEDIEARIKVVQCDTKELEKISPEASALYRLRNLTFQYKQPDKLRLQRAGTGTYILNGAIRFFAIPRLGLKKREDLSKSPGKRQSLLESVGRISEGTLRFMEGRFLREENLEGQKTEVYDMLYPKGGGSYYRVWIDPKTGITIRREWYDREDKLKATFTYLEPQEVLPGVWLPTRLEARNTEGSLAAAAVLEDVKVNQGIEDAIFAIAEKE